MAIKKRKRKSNLPSISKRSVSRTLPKKSRSRRRRPGLMSAGSNFKTIGMQVGMALAGGALGVVIRNAMPKDLNENIKGAGVAAAGFFIGSMAKQPMLAAGIIGSAGAYVARAAGMNYNIPLLSQENAMYATLMDGQPEPIVYGDENGNQLYRVQDEFYYMDGTLSPYTPQNFQF